MFLNDLLAVCNFIGVFNRKKKQTKYKPKAKLIDDEKDHGGRIKANNNYDARFKSIEIGLFQSVFYKKHNKIQNSSYI